jgi:hypothetical protein
LSNEVEPSSTLWASLQAWAYQGLQIIDLRLALVISAIAFLLVVSVDSAGNPAEAADLAARSPQVPVSFIQVDSAPGLSDPSFNQAFTAPAIGGPSSPAYRLHHGTMTSAIMTSSRLTQAHFFTDLPSGQ